MINLKTLQKTICWERSDTVRTVICAVVFLVVAVLYQVEIFKRFELVTYDSRCVLRGTRPADPRIVIIEISEDSVAQIGRWPWDRAWHATLIKILDELGVKVIAFDIVFSEPSDPKKDAALAQAIKQSGKVYLAEFIEKNPSDRAVKLLSSMPQFIEGARGGGHINLQPDVDGTMRRMKLLPKFDDQAIPQLSLDIFLNQYGVDVKDLMLTADSLKIPMKEGGVLEIPLDKKGNFIINWLGRWKDVYRHFSYVDVVSSYALAKKGGAPKIDLESLRGKFCYIGTTATGLFDIRPTPLEPSYPAVGVNLTILNNLLERKFIRPFSDLENIIVFFFLAVVLCSMSRIKSYFRTAFFSTALAVIYILFAFFTFVFFSVWVNIIHALILIAATYFCVTLYNQLSIAIERAKLLKLATRDSLTGLYNIGHFKMLLSAEISTLAIRTEKSVSIVMGDVDNFKKTNDTYGHVTGDLVLKEVSAVVRSTCRALDVAARYGGEEFILMLPGARVEDAFKVADKIRAAIAEKVFEHEKGNFSTSISIGVTQVMAKDTDLEKLVARVDKGLYEAKQTGKNRVVIVSADSAHFYANPGEMQPG